MRPYIFLMKSGEKIRVHVRDAHEMNDKISKYLAMVSPATHQINYRFIYDDGIISINLLDISAYYPEECEVE